MLRVEKSLAPCPEAGYSFAEALASQGEAESIIWGVSANRRDVEYLFAEPLAIWENAPC
jgi:hypothetical protein